MWLSQYIIAKRRCQLRQVAPGRAAQLGPRVAGKSWLVDRLCISPCPAAGRAQRAGLIAPGGRGRLWACEQPATVVVWPQPHNSGPPRRLERSEGPSNQRSDLPMAASTHSIRFALPWQSLTSDPEIHTARYALDLLAADGRPSHTLHLYHSSHDARWRWHITPYSRREAMQLSRHGGYSRLHLAERALLFALHRLLHPKLPPPHLPTSQRGADRHSRRGR